MKKVKILLFLWSFIVLIACKNDDNSPVNPVDALPPATQIGAQTFGCLVDGKPFFPDRFGSGTPSAFYQNINGFFTLGISATRRAADPWITVGLGAQDIESLTTKDYVLGTENSGFFAGYYLLDAGLELRVWTLDSEPGKLTITRFDEQQFIISGTFEFTVLDNDGKEIKITDGRFDLNYTN